MTAIARIAALALLLAAPRAIADDAPDPRIAAGLAAYRNHDLATAERLTRDALAHLPTDDGSSAPNERSAALAQLGTILDAKGDRAGAIAALRESLLADDSAAVRDQLRALDRAAAEALDAMAPEAMAGPFASLVDFCFGRQPEDAEACQSIAPRLAHPPVVAGPPIAALGVLKLPERDARWFVVKTAAGWYLRRLDEHLGGNGFHCGTERVVADRVIARPAGIVEVDYSDAASCFHRGESWSWSEQRIAVVGVGPSGVPMMSPGLTLRFEQVSEDGAPKVVATVRRRASWDAAGMLTITAESARGSGDAVDEFPDPVLGRHTFTFK